jgi:chromosome segregation ATPase
VDPLLAFAAELERRDADVAPRLQDVEARQHAVDAIRRRLADADVQLRRLPQLREEQERDEAAASDARMHALEKVQAVEEELAGARDSDRSAAERRLDDARASLRAVERELEHLERRRGGLEDDEHRAAEEVAAAAREAVELGAVVDLAGPADTLIAMVREWAAHERGALILEHSNLVRERDSVVREASELLASVLGDAAAVTSVSGLRARLERAAAL